MEVGFERERFQLGLNWKFNGKKQLKDYNFIEGIDNIEQTPYNLVTESYYGNPNWSTFNFNASYKLNSKITFYTSLDNIFDTHYKEFASSISASGRNLSLAVSINL